MRLLDVPFEENERQDARRMLEGCLCRICVSDDPLEIVRMVGFANSYISMLAQSRMLTLRERKKE